MSVRIEIRSLPSAGAAPGQSSAGQAIVRSAAALGVSTLQDCRIVRLYFLEHDPGADALQRLCVFLLADPVLEQATWRAGDQAPERARGRADADEGLRTGRGDEGPVAQAVEGVQIGQVATGHDRQAVEVAYRPGVTDVAARELARGMVEIGLPACEVATGTRYELGGELSDDDLRRLARGLLCNTTVQHFSLGPIAVHFGQDAAAADRVETVPLRHLAADELLALSKRRLLSLDLTEMRAIQHYYAELGRDPHRRGAGDARTELE